MSAAGNPYFLISVVWFLSWSFWGSVPQNALPHGCRLARHKDTCFNAIGVYTKRNEA